MDTIVPPNKLEMLGKPNMQNKPDEAAGMALDILGMVLQDIFPILLRAPEVPEQISQVLGLALLMPLPSFFSPSPL